MRWKGRTNLHEHPPSLDFFATFRASRSTVSSTLAEASCRIADQVFVAECSPVEFGSLEERVLPVLPVIVASDSEIREVVKEEAEGFLAIDAVLCGVQDVGMPEPVDAFGRHNGFFRVRNGKEQIPPVQFRKILDIVTAERIAIFDPLCSTPQLRTSKKNIKHGIPLSAFLWYEN